MKRLNIYIGDDEDYNNDSSGDGEYSQAALTTVSLFSSTSATYPTIGGFTNYLLVSTLNSKRGPNSFDPLLSLAPRAALLHQKPASDVAKLGKFASEIFKFN
jgi:hypothetical protein